MSLTLAIHDLQARVKSIEARLDDLARKTATPKPAPAKRKPKRRRKSP